jgi:lipopolysaccharide transport protein LptA
MVTLRVPFLKIVRCKPSGCPVLPALALTIMAAVTGITPVTDSIAGAQTAGDDKAGKEIHFKADRVIADLEANEAELLGNVRVSQDKTVITAKRMKIYYRDLKNEKSDSAIQQSIRKIIASGNVKISFDDMTALTEKAVYITGSEVLTLSGTNSKVISGPNSITGSKITFFRTNAKMIVEGSAQQQIQAVFVAGGKGSF